MAAQLHVDTVVDMYCMYCVGGHMYPHMYCMYMYCAGTLIYYACTEQVLCSLLDDQ